MKQTLANFTGFGLGLRRPHYREFLEVDVAVDFVEVISENFMIDGGQPLVTLEKVRERWPVALHGVSMSIGSVPGLNPDHLSRLKRLVRRIEPLFVSDHLCWTGLDGHNTHDLLPLPFTEEALAVVCRNIDRAQKALGREMLFENPSSYVSFPESALTEWEFLAEMSRRTGCGLLLDVNNIYVSACNNGFDVDDFLSGIPVQSMCQIHLAGHTPGDILIDTHDREVCDAVWSLYASAVRRFGPVATMIERDDNIPALAELLAELDIARKIAADVGKPVA
ncbi:DUF692 family protein [Porphyrobacter algicida]|uniref:UPF0276 protein GRI58_12950 n=1 Tax=Qipengyuania algicida TaxID=1836209 RepID=A0A845AJX6_9SPHN|nr:DUF692 family protein [Qipengyuania algicida]